LQGGGDGVDVFMHEGIAFGFDHDAGEFLGAGVADDDAAVAVEFLFGGGDGGGDRGEFAHGDFLAHFDVTDLLGEDLEVRGEVMQGFAGVGNDLKDAQGSEQAVSGG